MPVDRFQSFPKTVYGVLEVRVQHVRRFWPNVVQAMAAALTWQPRAWTFFIALHPAL